MIVEAKHCMTELPNWAPKTNILQSFPEIHSPAREGAQNLVQLSKANTASVSLLFFGVQNVRS